MKMLKHILVIVLVPPMRAFILLLSLILQAITWILMRWIDLREWLLGFWMRLRMRLLNALNWLPAIGPLERWRKARAEALLEEARRAVQEVYKNQQP